MNTNKFRRLSGAVTAVLIGVTSAISFSGCGNGNTQSSTTDNITETSAPSQSTADEATAVGALEKLGIDASLLEIEPSILHDSANTVGFQLDMPKQGDTVAVVHTSLGDFTMRFFPEQAPKAVTNFINLAKSGKYNNTTFHRVIKDFVVQGGHCGNDENSPNGVSSYGAQFEDEFCDKLFNIRGAVSMANTAKDSNGSQFFINQTSAEAFKSNGGWTKYENNWSDVKTQLLNYKDSNLLSAFIQKNGSKCFDVDIVPNEVRRLYEANGGNPHLDGVFNAVDRGNTVFAQVIDGMEIVDKIAAVNVNKDDKPTDNIVIKSVEIKEYSPSSNKQTDAASDTTSASQ